MANMGFFENLINSKLLSLHTAYLAKILSVKGNTAKIQPLGMSQAYNENAMTQSVLSNVPIIQSARYKLGKDKLNDVDVLVPRELEQGDVVICICCERDITEAKKGKNSVPVYGHHSMSDSVIVGVL